MTSIEDRDFQAQLFQATSYIKCAIDDLQRIENAMRALGLNDGAERLDEVFAYNLRPAENLLENYIIKK